MSTITPKRLPFDILPTATLVSAPYALLEPQPIHSISSTSSTTNQATVPVIQKCLDEEQGKKVLGLIYAAGGSIEKRTVTSTTTPVITANNGDKHLSSYYLSKNEKREEGPVVVEKESTSLDFIDKVNSFLKIESKGLVKHIDLQLLIDNNITIEDLVGSCKIGITDLVATGIIKNVKDLRALGFKMSDLVINRELFRAQHLPDLFKLTYQKLHKMKGIEFSAYDLINCEFYPNELSALSFSFDHLIQDNCLSAIQLKSLNYSLADLISLNFTKENLEMLGITRRHALDLFQWDRKEYAEFTGQPAYNKMKRKKG